jgi:hypothetical protein
MARGQQNVGTSIFLQRFLGKRKSKFAAKFFGPPNVGNNFGARFLVDNNSKKNSRKMSVRDDLKKNIIDFVKQIDQGCNKPVCLNYHCRKNPGKLTFLFLKKIENSNIDRHL